VTLFIGGATAIWLWGFSEETENDAKLYLFDAELHSSDDTIHITLIKGDPIYTTRMRLVFDGTFVPAGGTNLTAGDTLVVPLDIDIEPNTIHTLKIIIDYRTLFEEELSASGR
jgi:hypothetical protein